MRPMTQHVWQGWLGSVSADGTKYRLSWDEWGAWQRTHPQPRPASGTALPPGQHVIAAQAFLVWFDAAAGLRRDPPFDDRELAVRRYMHDFEEVAATRG
jgi:hypothetical protein